MYEFTGNKITYSDFIHCMQTGEITPEDGTGVLVVQDPKTKEFKSTNIDVFDVIKVINYALRNNHKKKDQYVDWFNK